MLDSAPPTGSEPTALPGVPQFLRGASLVEAAFARVAKTTTAMRVREQGSLRL